MLEGIPSRSGGYPIEALAALFAFVASLSEGALKLTQVAADAFGPARVEARARVDRMGIMQEVRLIGGALVFILIIALVLNKVYGAININNSSVWYPIVEDLETTGVAALGLLVVGLIIVAAGAIMRFMGNSGFGGR